ncbi:phage holin family protein [Paenibacillus sp. FSL M7-0802]|uniref:Phage-related holin n=1 Tax=Paenibacillus peoriae TaxID=59893 RepID=A0ABU1QI42_9BACL|nr:phage holin family protein [Paenibacillus peoriae]MDR6779306.1 phage-related holin [Paenibacillus peoriae]
MKENEFLEIMTGAYEYAYKSVEYVRPVFVFISTIVSYLLFPNEAYVAPTVGLFVALILDIATKYYAISMQNGGFRNAIITRKISSESMWRGTKKKLVSVLMVMICCGLFMRFTEFLPQIAIAITSICYGFMFFRETQSIAENLIDAGHTDMAWFLILVKKKKKEFMEDNDISEGNDSNDSTR